jgi:phytoene dehydrogenase-like protein
MTRRNDVIVIGAGHNGLVCATYLARAGLNVVVLEASNSAGGMIAPRALDSDYRFPGLAQASFPISPSICRQLKLIQYGYTGGRPARTVALDAHGRHLVIDGDSIAGDGLPDADASAWPAFRKQYLEFARSLKPLMESKPPRLKDMDFSDKTTLAKLGWNIRMGLGKERMYEFLRVAAINIYDVLNDSFDDERLKGAVATDAVLGSAMGPRTPGTVLTWLQRIYGELNGPLSVNTANLLDALTQAAEDAGVAVRTGARVEEILIENDKAFGVRLAGGEVVKSRIVVSNADPRTTFTELVGAARLDAMFANRVSQIRGSGVVGKLHLALSGKPEFTGLVASNDADRLLIAPSMRYIEQAFNPCKYGELPEHPVLEITVPSLNDPTLAPEGHHVMSVNVAFLPYAAAGGWQDQQSTFAYKLIALIGQYAPQLKSIIVDHEFLTPADVESGYHAKQGHWHHGELSIHQSFMMRPVYGAARYDTPIDSLFLCGAGCHPGGGVTGLPGRAAAKRVLEIGGVK